MIKDIKQCVKSGTLHWWLNPFVVAEIIIGLKEEKIKNPTTKLDGYKKFYNR